MNSKFDAKEIYKIIKSTTSEEKIKKDGKLMCSVNTLNGVGTT